MVSKSTIYKLERKVFISFFCITMFFPISSNIFQNDTEMLKEQHYEIQQRHEEEQWLLVCLEEVVEAHYAGYAA